MITIAVSNQKGGVGKTTLTTNLACALVSRGYSVLLGDTDPQRSASNWYAAAGETPPVEVLGMDKPGMIAAVARHGRGYDFVLLDGAPQAHELTVAAIKVADLVLVPVQPSPYDVWSSAVVFDLARSRRDLSDGRVKVAVVLNRVIAGTRVCQNTEEALAALGDIPVLATHIHNRVAFAESVGSGKGVMHLGAGEAVAEIAALTDEILALLGVAK